MPLTKEATSRYKIINDCIRNTRKPFPDMEVIREACEKKLGKSFTVSTIQKDIKALKEDEVLGYMAPIRYNRSNNGYYYSDPDYDLFNSNLNSLEIDSLVTATAMLKSLSGTRMNDTFNSAVTKLLATVRESYATPEINGAIPFVYMDSKSSQIGLKHFEFLYTTIKEQIPINFVYLSHYLANYRTALVHPYQLKEYDNAWYLIGYSVEEKKVRAYCLDQIYDPINLKIVFDSRKVKEVRKFDTNMLGVYPVNDAKLNRIHFLPTNHLANILMKNPMHPSQKIHLRDNCQLQEFSVDVILTYELVRWFFLNSPNIIKIKDDSVNELVGELFKDAKKYYV